MLRYKKGTIDHGELMLRQKNTSTDAEIHGYTYSDFSRNQEAKKSIADYIFMIGGDLISWSSRKQSLVVLSSCEVEYVVASYVACQAVWRDMLLEELKIIEPKKMKLFVDNKSAIDLKNHHVSW